jgi:hypothetical protein
MSEAPKPQPPVAIIPTTKRGSTVGDRLTEEDKAKLTAWLLKKGA